MFYPVNTEEQVEQDQETNVLLSDSLFFDRVLLCVLKGIEIENGENDEKQEEVGRLD